MGEVDTMLDATMMGYVAGIADNENNPFHYIQGEAWAWQYGFEQGKKHRMMCDCITTMERKRS